MVALVIVMLDERFDLGFEITRQEVVFQEDAVLQGLGPALDLALRLRVERSAAHMAQPTLAARVRTVPAPVR